MSEVWTFFRNFVYSPASIGSIIPSSRYLISTMISSVDWEQVKSVAELGAGTGTITRAINQYRSSGSSFYCFERDDDMRAELERRYLDVDFYEDAFLLRAILERMDIAGLDCVISGLPFANFSSRKRDQLLRDVNDCLNPGGVFLAFQYSRMLQPYLVSVYGELECQLVWANIPPAFVFICRKEATGVKIRS